MESEPTLEDIRRVRIVHPIPTDAAVRVMEGQVYKNTPECPLCFDLYAPSVAGPARAAVILIRGGPVPRLGARRLGIFVSYGELMASAGLIGIAFDHRFLGAEHLPAAASDVADLISHARDHAGALGIDPGRLARAGRDAPELNSTVDRFAAAALASGLTLDLLTHPSGRHGFDVLDAHDRSAQIIQRTLAALQCSLAGGVA
jgi:acetyl esterase/lipase